MTDRREVARPLHILVAYACSGAAIWLQRRHEYNLYLRHVKTFLAQGKKNIRQMTGDSFFGFMAE